MIRSYTELSKLDTFEERFRYLKLDGSVGIETYGFDRYINQVFYRSRPWYKARREVIMRDEGCDLGILSRPIFSRVLIHHMNPITMEQILERDPIIFDPEYLITTVHRTHNAIHYSDESILVLDPIERTPNDTCPWK